MLDKKTIDEVLGRINQQQSCVSEELCRIVDPDDTGIIEVEGQQKVLSALGVPQTEVDLFRMTREEFKQDFAQYFE